MLPATQNGVAVFSNVHSAANATLPGGLTTIRTGLGAAGMHSPSQLQQLVATEEARHRATMAAAAAVTAAATAGSKAQQEQKQQKQALSQAWEQAKQDYGCLMLEEQGHRVWGQVMCLSQCGSIAAKWRSRLCCGACCWKAGAAVGGEAVLCVRHKDKTPAMDEAAAAEDSAAEDSAAEDSAAKDSAAEDELNADAVANE
jgi:hypothetical protein